MVWGKSHVLYGCKGQVAVNFWLELLLMVTSVSVNTSKMRIVKYTIPCLRDGLWCTFTCDGIRLHGIFVFHDGHCVRLADHSVINTCCLLVRCTTLSVALTNSGQENDRESRKCHGYRRNIKEPVVGIVKLDKKNLAC